MKRLLSFFVLFLLVSCSKEVHDEQIVKRQDVAYEINSTTPFTGRAVDYFENDRLWSRTNYKDGKENGLREIFYENGQLRQSAKFKDGKFDGLIEHYYENGQLKNKGNYKDGKEEGFWEIFYENGQLQEKSIYKNGIIDGSYESYYENGQLSSKGIMKDGRFIGEYDAYTYSGEKKILGIDKIIEDFIAMEINKYGHDACEDELTNFDIEFMNSPLDDEFIDYFSNFVRGTNLKDELEIITFTHETYEELESYVNFYLNRYKFSDYHWKKIFRYLTEHNMQTLERCNAGENIISAHNTFQINRDRLFENIFKPNEVNLIDAENDVKQQIDEFFDYAFGFDSIEECKEDPDCLKVFKAISD